jgi:soluble lytic murein transglycosylase-like protein
MRRRSNGVFLFGFGAVFVVQMVTGFVPGVPSIAAPSTPAEAKEVSKEFKVPKGAVKPALISADKPVRKGSIPNKRFEDLINVWGRQCETLSPAILAAQMYQESGFRTSRDTVSSANAQGFAQFIPSTWKVHGKDGDGDGKADVWNPEDAIPSAAMYDCYLARIVRNEPGDDVGNMLASYNAGAGRVKEHDGVPPPTFARGETYNYVKNIKAMAKEKFS